MSAREPAAPPSTADLDAARLLLARMGLSARDLLDTPPARRPVPTFAAYVPVVAAAVGDGTRRVYGSYWNRILEHWADRRLDEPTPSEIKQLHCRRPEGRGSRRSRTTQERYRQALGPPEPLPRHSFAGHAASRVRASSST